MENSFLELVNEQTVELLEQPVLKNLMMIQEENILPCLTEPGKRCSLKTRNTI